MASTLFARFDKKLKKAVPVSKKEEERMLKSQYPHDKIATAKTQHYLHSIWAIGCDYDGYENVKGLKSVIDELVSLANKAAKSLKPLKKTK